MRRFFTSISSKRKQPKIDDNEGYDDVSEKSELLLPGCESHENSSVNSSGDQSCREIQMNHPPGDLAKPMDGNGNSSNPEWYESNSRLISFGQNSNYYYSTMSNGNGDEEDDDDDLSYDNSERQDQSLYQADHEEPVGGGNREEFKLHESVVTHLRNTDSLFFSKKRNVQYVDSDHFGVITTMYGSVWKQVLPFCLFNFFWCLTIDYLRDQEVNKYESNYV